MTYRQADGRGSGVLAGVDKRHRTLVAAYTETESNAATLTGLKYNINTGLITLINASKTTVLYLKNNDTRDLIIDTLIYNLGQTNGTGDRIIDVIRNPMTGDIITNANPVAVGMGENANLKYSSKLTLKADVYVGASGETPVSDGGLNIITIDPNPSGRILISPGGGVLLGQGDSIAFNYTPPTGNTSQTACFAMNVYIREDTD